MSKEFIELSKENLSSGKMNSGKIIKGSNIKIANKTRIISGEFENKKPQDNNISKSNEDKKNTFTINPKFNENELEELGVECSCGNQTKIVFNKDEQNNEEIVSEPLPIENESMDLSQIEEN